MNAELNEVVHLQSNELFDVVTLINVAIQMAEQLDDDLSRILVMAAVKISAIQEAFDPHI